MGTVTLDRVVSVGIGAGGLKTSPEGEWDEFWYGGLVIPLLTGYGAYGDAAITKISRAGNAPLR